MGTADGLRVNAHLTIPVAELDLRTGPSGGPGGQHANRAHTRVEVRFDVNASRALRSDQRALLLERLGPVVVAASDNERSQLRNKERAMARLADKVASALHVDPLRRPTRPGRGAVARRLEDKERTATRKRERRVSRDDW